MAKLPDFQKLWDAYPNGDPVEVGHLIGGAIGAGIGEWNAEHKLTGWIQNTCTIRLSRAFNYEGKNFHIPRTHTFADKKTPKTMSTVYGADKMRYAFRVSEFLKYLKEKFGKPPISAKKERGDATVPEVFQGRTGIIVFNDCGWSDATGHVDLWNGSECKHEAYWFEAKEAYLWPTETKWGVTTAVDGQLTDGQTPIVTVSQQ